MEENVVEKIREFVEEECKKPSSKYGYEAYENHFVFVVKNAKILAEKLNVDEELVEIAAWLHDIGSILCGRENHHINGAEIAEKKLKEFGYPEEKILLVKNCILNHRGSVNNKKEHVEEKIIADADAISNFNNLSGIFKAAFIFENKNQEEAKESIKKKLIGNWNKLSLQESKELIKPKYEAAMLLFGE
jgi:uncharacterized protein